MNIKKLFILQLLMINSLTCGSDDKNDKTDKNVNEFITPTILLGVVMFTGYMWATSGDSVEQRIEDAQSELETMTEYEQDFDISPRVGQKESQILSVLEALNIDLDNLTASYDEKLRADSVTLQKVYNNLWFKSFYGGQEIAEITRKVGRYQTKIQGLLNYLEQHKKFIKGYQIISESKHLAHKSLLANKHEILSLAQSHDGKTSYPLFTYVKKIIKDLECIQFLMTEKNAQQDYPALSLMIAGYQERLEEIKHTISIMEEYKHEALAKLENDISQLTERHNKLELVVKQLQVDVAIAKMR